MLGDQIRSIRKRQEITLKELAEKINYHQDNGVTEDTVDFLSVTRENLYDRDTENILFPNIS